jgi:amidase
MLFPPDDRLNAFCPDSRAYLQGADEGPLAGLTFAAKDIFDVKGHVTGGGNPDWKASQAAAEANAWAVEVLVGAGATMVGKTHTDELTRGILGVNAHYGTPLNPRAAGRVPGGSSSGSAAAVAGGLVDFALGSDTGGSVRIPASFCGLYGLRPTHGRIPLDGMLLQAPSYDTVGWFARDPDLFARVGSVLLQTRISPARPRRMVVAEDAFEVADEPVRKALEPLVKRLASLIGLSSRERLAPTSLSDWAGRQRVRASSESWEVVREWIDRMNPRMSFQVAESCLVGRSLTSAEVAAALAEREKVKTRMRTLLAGDTVVCLPTAPTTAPPRSQTLSERLPLTSRIVQLTCPAGTIGAPQINLPWAEVEGLPVGLSLLGAPGSDEMLIAFARQVAQTLQIE